MIYSYLLYTKIRILSILLRAHNPPYNNAFISCKHFLVYQSDGYLTLNPLDSKFSKNEKDGANRPFFRYFCISISNFPSEFTLSRNVLTYRLQKFSISFMVAVTLVAS